MKFPLFQKGLLLCIAAVGLLCVSSAKANIDQSVPAFGDLLRWGVFTLGGGVTDDQDQTSDQNSGSSYIKGDVGVAGNGNISLSGNSVIDGNLYYEADGTYKQSGNAHVTGLQHHGDFDADLNNGVQEAYNSSKQAASYAASGAYASIQNVTGTMNFTAQHDRTGNSTVLSLQNFTLSGSSVVTLSGSASDVFIINVSNQFSLSGSSKIVLSGGLTVNDVLFNVTGKNPNQVQLSGNSELNGVLMANYRTAQLSGNSVVNGEVIANQLNISGNAQVLHPATTSP
jgi:cytoskeletal protein CcmA (bactofilin family)